MLAKVLKGCRALVVEDSADNALLLKTILSMHGAEVSVVADGAEGVKEALGDHRYDVVLMDSFLPSMCGSDAAKTLRARGFRKPIVAVTGDERLLSSYHEAGFDGCLVKPFSRAKLIGTLHQVLDGTCKAKLGGLYAHQPDERS